MSDLVITHIEKVLLMTTITLTTCAFVIGVMWGVVIHIERKRAKRIFERDQENVRAVASALGQDILRLNGPEAGSMTFEEWRTMLDRQAQADRERDAAYNMRDQHSR